MKLSVRSRILAFVDSHPIPILIAITLIGAFFRVYHFHDWLWFFNDQVRDVRLISQIVEHGQNWPLLGPSMLYTAYHLGPIYYYFQIISGLLFGVEPYTVAYPDLLFSVLTIPLFFVFVRRYFDTRLSLLLSGMLACSFFFVRYGRFAWNINPLPFFSILYLLALHEFLTKGTRVGWKWILALGIGIGVGVQLHAIALLLILSISLVVFAFMTFREKGVVWKWLVAFSIAIVLNAGAITYDIQNDFANSKAFLTGMTTKQEATEKAGIVEAFGRDIDCTMETHYQVLTSFGNREYCDFYFTSIFSKISKNLSQGEDPLRKVDFDHAVDRLDAAFGIILLLFSGIGTIHALRKQRDRRKRIFLLLLISYVLVSFMILYPVGEMLKGRYYLHIIFVSLISIGFFFQFLHETFPNKGKWFISAFAIALLGMNLFSLIQSGRLHAANSASKEKNPIYGELVMMERYIREDSSPTQQAHLTGTKLNRFTFGATMKYVAERNGFNIQTTSAGGIGSPAKVPIYYIATKGNDYDTFREKGGREILYYETFGNHVLYRLSSETHEKDE